MSFEYEILETFNTSIGFIAMIKFTPAKFPGIGAEVYYNQQKYKIAGSTSTSQPIGIEAINKIDKMHEQGIWDCLLKLV
jgi:hypothetical protein